MEIWKPIPGYEAHYEVSRDGFVRSIPRLVKNGPGGGRLTKQTMLRASMVNGYPMVGLSVSGKNKLHYVHRLVCLAFHGPCPSPGYEVRHLDGNKANNRSDNLAWGTHLENMADNHEHGCSPRGERNPNALLTSEKVRAIRMDKRPRKAVAKDYGITPGHVHDLRIRRSWKWLD